MNDHWPPFTPRLTYFHTVVQPIQFGPSSSFQTVKHSSSYVFVCLLPPADGRVIADDDRIYLFAFVLILSGCHHFSSSLEALYHHNIIYIPITPSIYSQFLLSSTFQGLFIIQLRLWHINPAIMPGGERQQKKKIHREKVPIHRAKLENQFNCSASRRAQAEQKLYV